MSVVKELIRTEENGKISFGNYELAQSQRYPTLSTKEIYTK